MLLLLTVVGLSCRRALLAAQLWGGASAIHKTAPIPSLSARLVGLHAALQHQPWGHNPCCLAIGALQSPGTRSEECGALAEAFPPAAGPTARSGLASIGASKESFCGISSFGAAEVLAQCDHLCTRLLSCGAMPDCLVGLICLALHCVF